MTAFNPRIGKISYCALALAPFAAPLAPALAAETGALTQAIADSTRALTLTPNNVDALLGRGTRYDISRQFAVCGLD